MIDTSDCEYTTGIFIVQAPQRPYLAQLREVAGRYAGGMNCTAAFIPKSEVFAARGNPDDVAPGSQAGNLKIEDAGVLVA